MTLIISHFVGTYHPISCFKWRYQ